ncbi:MAG TPA: site-2 protease family protein [Pyrinomonadaceae bacterium]|nr:site-2 protease family protein [Pyrinomonadaceae bacterium]
MSVEQIYLQRQAMRPTARTWLLHALFLLVTLATATIAGVLYPFGRIDSMPVADPQTWPEILDFVATLPSRYAALIADAVYKLGTDTSYLADGLSFSLSLLFILVSHEMGHYVACRIYGVDATLPFFIPTPPMIGPAGTFGAFIKIKSPMPSLRAVFDIGVAGPIAGFVALIPIAFLGVWRMRPAPPELLNIPGGLTFADPLFMRIAGAIVGHDPTVSVGNPFYYAAWVGLLVTALNLIPSGQLDGGHAIYAVLGKKVHFFTGRIAFVLMTALAILGFVFYSSPSGFLVAVLLGIMTRVGHPHPYDETPLDIKRKLIAFATLMIFVVCFVPFPIRIN